MTTETRYGFAFQTFNFGRHVELLVTRTVSDESGQVVEAAGSMTFDPEPIEQDMLLVPTIKMTADDVQRLFDTLWDRGIRPGPDRLLALERMADALRAERAAVGAPAKAVDDPAGA